MDMWFAAVLLFGRYGMFISTAYLMEYIIMKIIINHKVMSHLSYLQQKIYAYDYIKMFWWIKIKILQMYISLC